MTNEQAKQEAIKKAYGEHEFSSRAIYLMDRNGCIEHQYSNNEMNLYSDLFESNGYGRFRLKSLRDIEENNGWIRIEPDGSNLPIEGYVRTCYSTAKHWIVSKIDVAYYNVESMFKGSEITHYKPITPELKPIY